jgi:hypothetical protein
MLKWVLAGIALLAIVGAALFLFKGTHDPARDNPGVKPPDAGTSSQPSGPPAAQTDAAVKPGQREVEPEKKTDPPASQSPTPAAATGSGAAGSGAVASPATPQRPSISIPTGEFSILNVHSELCLSPAGGGANGKNAPIVQYTCDKDLARFWRFIVVEGDVVQIRNSATNMCLTVAGGGTGRNLESVQYFCDDDLSRRWRYAPIDDTTFRLVNVNSHLCLTIAGGDTALNRVAVQFPCDGDPARDWRITHAR